LSGIWQYTLTSDVNHIALHGSLKIVMDGASVGGDFIEDFPDGSSKGVHGSFNGVTLELARDTGKNAMQNYYLTRQDDNRLTGSFRNVGAAETRDDGSFIIVR
jgi:hypothetical protein